MQHGKGGETEESIVRVDEDLGEVVPPALGVHWLVVRVHGAGWEGEQDACLSVFVGEGRLEGEEMFAGEEDSVKEPVLVLGTD